MDDNHFKETIKEEQGKLKGLTLAKKLEYIWDYYKLQLAGIIIIIILIGVVVQIVQNMQVKTELHVAITNCVAMNGQDETFRDGFASYAGLDGEKQEVVIDTVYQIMPGQMDPMTMNSQTKIMAQVSAGALDVMVVPEDVFAFYQENGIFKDLKEVLSEEAYAALQGQLLMDKAKGDTEERAYGLKLEENDKLKGITSYEPAIVCVISNAEHTKNAEKFVQYLLL